MLDNCEFTKLDAYSETISVENFTTVNFIIFFIKQRKRITNGSCNYFYVEVL